MFTASGKKRKSLSSEVEQSESKEFELINEPANKRRKINYNAANDSKSSLVSPRAKHDHDCSKHKVRKRIQFYAREPLSNESMNVRLLFQFKHSFCDGMTFGELLLDIAPKLGKKINGLNSGEYLLQCLNNGEISLYSHIVDKSGNNSETNSISNWDEILDFNENVIDIVCDSDEVLTLLQNKQLKPQEKEKQKFQCKNEQQNMKPQEISNLQENDNDNDNDMQENNDPNVRTNKKVMLRNKISGKSKEKSKNSNGNGNSKEEGEKREEKEKDGRGCHNANRKASEIEMEMEIEVKTEKQTEKENETEKQKEKEKSNINCEKEKKKEKLLKEHKNDKKTKQNDKSKHTRSTRSRQEWIAEYRV